MAYSHYERLSALDALFLDLEDGAAHMHIGSVAIFDAKPLATPEGGIDFPRILRAAEWGLRSTIRLRQKIVWVPRLDHPVWVDDDRFNLSYHVRHTALAAPGSVRQLKRLAGRIMSQQLDRGKPLWEQWFVEGLEGERFACITKIHHCLADGISGADLFQGMMGHDVDYQPGEPQPWVARPAPSPRKLLAGELSRRARLPLGLIRAGRRVAAAPRAEARGSTLDSLRDTARSVGDFLSTGFTSAADTPFNAELGPHRRFDWTRFDIDVMREVKRSFDAKLNDVVLAVVAGAVRRFLSGRGLRVSGDEFRAMIPVNVRREGQHDALGNQVSQMLARLPIDEADPRRRMQRVLEVTRKLKRSGQQLGGELMSELGEWTGTGLLPRLARLGLQARAANLVVTNVPGPPQPIYLAGARMLEVYPVVPLASHQTLGIALFSYAGGFHWGLNADWDALPDLHELAQAIDLEFEVLRKAATERPPDVGGGGDAAGSAG